MAKARKYKKVSCHTTKAAAKKEQAKMHKAGKTASIRKDAKTGKQCIFTAGKKKR